MLTRGGPLSALFSTARAHFRYKNRQSGRVLCSLVSLSGFFVSLVVRNDQVIVARRRSEFCAPLGVGRAFEALVELARQSLAAGNERDLCFGQRFSLEKQTDLDRLARAHRRYWIRGRHELERVPERAIEARIFHWDPVERFADDEKRLGTLDRAHRFPVIDDF